MRVKVKFRYNTATGQVEVFEVADDDPAAAGHDAAHDKEHDRITAEVAGVIERQARFTEVLPGTAAPRIAEPEPDAEPAEGQAEREKRKGAGP